MNEQLKMNLYNPWKQLILFPWNGAMFLLAFHLGEPIALYPARVDITLLWGKWAWVVTPGNLWQVLVPCQSFSIPFIQTGVRTHGPMGWEWGCTAPRLRLFQNSLSRCVSVFESLLILDWQNCRGLWHMVQPQNSLAGFLAMVSPKIIFMKGYNVIKALKRGSCSIQK